MFFQDEAELTKAITARAKAYDEEYVAVSILFIWLMLYLI